MAADIVDTVTVTGTTARPTAALAAGTYFWRARARVGAMTAMRASATWMFIVPGRDSAVDSTSGFVADFNGDGYADTAIAAPASRSNRGVVFTYHGSSTGLSSTPTTTIEGLEPNESFGQRAVSIGGDINGDGYSDLLVSSRQNAYVFLGSPMGLSVSPSALFMGSVGHGAGDLDRDGYGDALIAQPEAMVGMIRGVGSVATHHGSSVGLSMTASRTVTGTVINENFGGEIAALGDVNGDGFSDVAISSTNARPGGFTGAGQARVFHGGAGGLAATASWTGNGTSEFQNYGFSLSRGDLNGDGFSDLVVGAPSTSATRAFAYFGSAAGVSATASVTWNGDTAGDGFGTAVACGDTDRDGFADVLIGAPIGTPMQSGFAWVFRGAATPMTTAVRAYTGSAMARLGAAVAVIGDCNGDGFDDIAVSSPDPVGVVRVHLGSAGSVGVGVHQTYTGDAASSFGTRLAR
jgi:hypothetical protein